MVAALYRRYRPESFTEMIGQQQVTEPLMTALRTGRINHAYLFSGPRGCGKTSSARILARCLNCAQGPTPTPCGECASCRELGRNGGGSLDVVEIDAASHGGVDDARDLRERAVTAPARDRFKIFIIDEAHMVTGAGFNALLKVVEEPPEHVLFIFATTEPEKVIGTIRSRTHHFPFRLIPPATMLQYVGEICEQEGVTAEPGVLPLVVRAGGGSARDTLSLLDQLIAGTDGVQMHYEMASQLLGFTSQGLLDATITAFADGDAAEAYRSIDAVIQSGQDPRRFVEDLLERVRDLIVAKATGAGAGAVLRGISTEELDRLLAASARFAPAGLAMIADTVNGTLTEMSGVTAPRVQLELMVAHILVALRVSFGGADAAGGADADAGVAGAGAGAQASPGTSVPAATSQGAGAPGQQVPARQATERPAPERPAPERPAPERSGASAGESSGGAPTPTEPVVDAATQATSAWAAAEPVKPVDARPGQRDQRNDTARPHADSSSNERPAESADAGGRGAPDSRAGTASQPRDGQIDHDRSTATGGAGDLRATQPAGAAARGPADIDLARVRTAWPEILESVQRLGGRAAWSVVQQLEPNGWQDGVLRVIVPSRGLSQQLRSASGQGKAPGAYLKDALRQAFGFDVQIQPRVRTDDGGPAQTPPAPPTDAEGNHPPSTWSVAKVPTGAADDGPGSGWDELATEREGLAPSEMSDSPGLESTHIDESGPSAAVDDRASAGPSGAGTGVGADASDDRAPEVIAARHLVAQEHETAPEHLPETTVHVSDPSVTQRVQNPVAPPTRGQDAPAAQSVNVAVQAEPADSARVAATRELVSEVDSDAASDSIQATSDIGSGPRRSPDLAASADPAAAPEPVAPATAEVSPPASATWTVAKVGGADESEADASEVPAGLRVIMPEDLPEPERHPANYGGNERYGEAVVREKLGARFVGEELIEDIPVPSGYFAPSPEDTPPDDYEAPPEE